jgi:hypothetical protein
MFLGLYTFLLIQFPYNTLSLHTADDQVIEVLAPTERAAKGEKKVNILNLSVQASKDCRYTVYINEPCTSLAL